MQQNSCIGGFGGDVTELGTRGWRSVAGDMDNRDACVFWTCQEFSVMSILDYVLPVGICNGGGGCQADPHP